VKDTCIKKFLFVLVLASSLLTPGCAKNEFRNTASNSRIMVGATLAGLIGGIKYFGTSLGIRKKKQEDMPCTDESHKLLL